MLNHNDRNVTSLTPISAYHAADSEILDAPAAPALARTATRGVPYIPADRSGRQAARHQMVSMALKVQ